MNFHRHAGRLCFDLAFAGTLSVLPGFLVAWQVRQVSAKTGAFQSYAQTGMEPMVFALMSAPGAG